MHRGADGIDRAQAALDERQARIRLLEELTDEQKAAIEKVFRENDVVASTVVAEKREACPSPGCGRDFLRSGIMRHIRAAHEKDVEELQQLVRDQRAALR